MKADTGTGTDMYPGELQTRNRGTGREEEVEMFQIFIIAGWAAVLIILLYMWADVREISTLVKENKRELLRSNLSQRAGESFPNLREEHGENERENGSGTEEIGEKQNRTVPLSASEERVLDEVLSEFLS